MSDAASLSDLVKPSERHGVVAAEAVRSLLIDHSTARLSERKLAQVNRLLVDLYGQLPGSRDEGRAASARP